MNKFFKKYIQKIAYVGGIAISSLVLGYSLQLIHAWVEPLATPPAGNLGAPISTGVATQIKTGGLYVNGGTVTPILYDTNNTGYYVDPASTSRLNYGVYDNLYSYGWLQSPLFYDANNNGYYVDPASTSRLNYGVYDNLYSYGWTYSPISYDTNNPGYYVDPNSYSNLNYLCLNGDCKNAWPTSGTPSSFLNVDSDLCGWPHPYLGCPSGYSSGGKWYIDMGGAANCDNLARGIGLYNGSISAGFMVLCYKI
jgi:hypothetical protein